MAKGEERQKKKAKAIKGKGKRKVAETEDEDLDAEIDAFIPDDFDDLNGQGVDVEENAEMHAEKLPPPPKFRPASAKKVAETSCKLTESRKRLREDDEDEDDTPQGSSKRRRGRDILERQPLADDLTPIKATPLNARTPSGQSKTLSIREVLPERGESPKRPNRRERRLSLQKAPQNDEPIIEEPEKKYIRMNGGYYFLDLKDLLKFFSFPKRVV